MWSIGVDIGGTKIEVAHVNSNGDVERRIRFDTRADRKPQEIQDDIIRAAKELQAKADIKPEGVGVGVAGQVEKNTGIVRFAPNLQWRNVPLQDNLFTALNLPVNVTNDVRAATQAEWMYGSGKGNLDFICIFLGTGIGSGIVSDGRLLTGENNSAGEFGHMTVQLQGSLCTCGNHGCLETLAGGWGIVKCAEDELANDAKINSVLRSQMALTAKDVINAAKAQDPIAQKVIKRGEDALIAGVSSLLNLINPQVVIIGGGLSQGWPNLIDTLTTGVKTRALQSATQGVKIIPALRGDDAVVIGAASLFF